MKNLMKLFPARFTVATALFFACATLAQAQSAPGYQAPAKPAPREESLQTRAARGQAPMRKLYDYLRADSAKTKRLPALTAAEKGGKARNKALQTGTVRSLGEALDPISDSAHYRVPEGDVRVMSIVSEGALYTRVQFAKMNLPNGARVFVYSAANPDEFYGPYEGSAGSDKGILWTPPIKGDSVVIEYFMPANVNSSTPFTVSRIAHVFLDPTSQMSPKVGGCHNEVAAPWTDTAKATGRLDFVSGAGTFLCTGTMLADNVPPPSDIPYVLTANHCFNTQGEASTLRVWWNYNTNPPGQDTTPPAGTPFTDGSTLLATGTASDFTLVRLTGTVPGGLFFSGWDATTFTGTADTTGIHHPDGSHKRISFATGRQPTSQAECDGSGVTGLQCLAVDWNRTPNPGVTEGGSSGSGIWKGLPTDVGGAKLIGTLSGGPSACGVAPANLKDFYGRFSVTYPSIAAFLEGTNCVTSVSPTSQNFSASGGSGSFSVTAPGGCNWTAVASDSWVTVTAPANGTGNGTVNFNVAANSGVQRSASINVGGVTFSITQAGGGPCGSNPISFGQTLNGTLTSGDCPFGDGTFYDTYTFSGTAGQQIQIVMRSANFDTYLWLFRPGETNPFAQDDDGAPEPPPNTDSQIPTGGGFLTLPVSGTYTIWANAFEPPGLGNYSITLNVNAPVLQLSQATFSVNEDAALATITVTRSGVTSGAATVRYATSDLAGLQACTVANTMASERCDYTTAVGRVTFAAGETSKTFTVPIVNDVWVEGNETFSVTLSSPTGAVLGTQTTSTVQVVDNDFTAPTSNPIFGVEYFIRSLYRDILGRQPDSTGLQNWIDTLTPCPNGGFGEPPTSNCDRLHVAGGFFQSDEYLNRGYWAFRFYMVSFNQRPTYAQFIPDMSEVGGPKSPAEEEAAKVAYADAFVQRSTFLAQYSGLSGQPLADALTAKTGLPSFTVTGGMTNGQILRAIAERQSSVDKFLTEGTVSILYFGFQRRDPDATGYQNNVDTLNANPNNLRHMIFIFIYSTEYLSRFGPP